MTRSTVDPSFPKPPAVRLVRSAGAKGRRRAPRPPFGLRVWSDAEEAAVVVLLQLPADGASDEVGPIAAQIPAASSLRDGTLVVVLETAERAGGLLSRLLRPEGRVPLVVRGSALLARGYSGIRAGVDPASGEELAWGCSPAMR
jgi:hypothetical protein